MVHALREIRNLLKPNGALIDIRPNGELNEFIRPHRSREHFIGYMRETDDYIEYRQAEAAVQEVVAAGLFHIQKKGEFEFRIHADSFAETGLYCQGDITDLTRGRDRVARVANITGIGSIQIAFTLIRSGIGNNLVQQFFGLLFCKYCHV